MRDFRAAKLETVWGTEDAPDAIFRHNYLDDSMRQSIARASRYYESSFQPVLNLGRNDLTAAGCSGTCGADVAGAAWWISCCATQLQQQPVSESAASSTTIATAAEIAAAEIAAAESAATKSSTRAIKTTSCAAAACTTGAF